MAAHRWRKRWAIVIAVVAAAVGVTLLRVAPGPRLSSGTRQMLYDARTDPRRASERLQLTTLDRQRPLTSNARERFEPAEAATVLDTTGAWTEMAGYAARKQALPRLTRDPGFRVDVALRVCAEDHLRPDRAGVSVTVLASDLRGVELGFWRDRIFAQEGGAPPTLFVHAEEVAFDTTKAMTRYSLEIVNDGYTLSANDEPILRGAVRDYRAWTPPWPAFPDAYEQASSIVVSDNTTSARGCFALQALEVTVL